MSNFNDERTATIRATLDGNVFEFNATGNGKRIVVSTGMRKLFHNKYWNPIQDKCLDVLPAGNNRESVPTAWFMPLVPTHQHPQKPNIGASFAWSI
jgi:hypothetical protein